MKNKLLLFFILTSYFCTAQKVDFEYDLAGNQIKRSICINCRKTNNETPKQTDNPITDNIISPESEKNLNSDLVSYYPNPVKEELYLQWQLVNDNKVSFIQLSTLSGQVLKVINNLQFINSQVISFFNYPTGVYIVLLNYTNGDQKTIKIIKE